MVAIGTLISAFWIISANSWMQTPQGYAFAADGTMVATSFVDVIFNPSMPSRFFHMVLAAFLTTSMVVAGASAFLLLVGEALAEARTALRMAVLMMALVTPVQILAGHESGLVAGEHQPAKIAALEGWWTTRAAQPTVLIGWPDERAERNHFALSIPGFGSAVNNAGPDDVLPGLDQFEPQERPPVWIVFWSFRIMVAMGLIMLALGLWGAFNWIAKRLDRDRWHHRALVLAAPSGFIAVLTGWITAEVGRQPYVVYGVMRTADAMSPVPAGSVATSLLFFIVVYAIVFSAGALYILRLMRKGPEPDESVPTTDEPPGTPTRAGVGEAG
jgi:cytochrome d ubiquinol oxidase subunit I